MNKKIKELEKKIEKLEIKLHYLWRKESYREFNQIGKLEIDRCSECYIPIKFTCNKCESEHENQLKFEDEDIEPSHKEKNCTCLKRCKHQNSETPA